MTQPYSQDELNNDYLAFLKIMRNHDLNFECCIPVTVIEYNRANNIVTAQGAINHISFANESIPRVPFKVPCFNPCGNGIGINFPIKAGDTGWVIGADVDTELFMQSLKTADPNTGRLHCFAFGFFIPDKIKGFQIAEEDADALVIQTLDGKTKITLKNGNVTVLSADTVNVQCTNANVNASQLNLTAESTVTGNITVTGNLTVNGTITATTDTLVGSVSLKSHIHKLGDVPTTSPVQN